MNPEIIPKNARVTTATQAFKNAILKIGPERAREAANWNMLDQTMYRGWILDPQTLTRMINEGRAPHSINIIKRPVDTIAGSIASDQYKPKFDSESGEPSEFGMVFQELLAEDMEIGEWEGEMLQWLRAAFVYTGWIEFYKDYSKDIRGRVRVRYLPPDRVIRDPNWTTTDVNNNQQIFTFSYLTIDQIKNTWGGDNPRLVQAINEMQQADKYAAGISASQRYIPWDNSPELLDVIDQTYLVYNCYYLEKKPYSRIVDFDNDAKYRDDVPEEHREEFVKNAKALGANMSIIKDFKFVEMVVTACPSISMADPLAEGEYPLQGNGYHLVPVFQDHINGHPHTVVDILTDPNRLINKRESTITHILSTLAGNAKMVETDIAEPAEVERIVRNLNMPGFVGKVKSGGGQHKKIWSVDKGAPPTDFQSASNNMMKIAQNDLTPAVPAVQGQGAADESGIAFQSKVAQALIGMVMSKGFVKKALDRFYNLYIEYARQVYTYPMVLNGKESGKVYRLNMPGGLRLADIPRIKLTLAESPNSSTRRSLMLQESASMLQYMPGTLTKFEFSVEMIKNAPNMAEDSRAKLVASAELEAENARLDLGLAIVHKRNQLLAATGAAPAALPGGLPPEAPPVGMEQGTATPNMAQMEPA